MFYKKIIDARIFHNIILPLQDYGMWERGDKTNQGIPELNGSSVGMAKVENASCSKPTEQLTKIKDAL